MALRIKDNINLKELEKFGFKFDEDNGKYIYDILLGFGMGKMALIIQSWNRKIYLWSNTSSSKNEEIIKLIYELIKADLIEKVGD